MKELCVKRLSFLCAVFLLAGCSKLTVWDMQMSSVNENEEIFRSLTRSMTPVSSLNEDATKTLPKTLGDFEQIAQSLNHLGGLSSTSGNLKREIASRITSLPEKNSLSLMSAPVLLASTSIAGQVCADLISQEKSITNAATRRYLKTIDFKKGPAQFANAEAFVAAHDGMIQDFWHRSLNTAERSLYIEYFNDMTGLLSDAQKVSAIETERLLQGSCAVTLSSFESLTY